MSTEVKYLLIKMAKTFVLLFGAVLVTVLSDQVFFDLLKVKVSTEIYPIVYFAIYTLTKILKLKLADNSFFKEIL